ncbi:MAG: hypothetical protein P8N76_01550 [Pirellulaceae bacterium]|nr:hypothetical protein [Pirellulaceae bacterium]
MDHSNDDALPIDAWSADMQAAIAEICDLGQATLARHSTSSVHAAQVAQDWELSKRLEDERIALRQLFDHARQIIETVELTRQQIEDDTTATADLHESLRTCAALIHSSVPELEKAFLTSRHSALDLLRWTQRSGHLADSDLPTQYRASYARLLEYTPVFKPRMEAMQHDLLRLRHDAGLHEDVQRLLSALTRYNGVTDAARRFVQSVVKPPLDLVFHETATFESDWQGLTPDVQSELGTEINDSCQLLLYDPTRFIQQVELMKPTLADGVEASLYVQSVDSWRIFFTVDEDPVFKELRVTLFRVVDQRDFAPTCQWIIEHLYRDLTDD